MVLPLLLCCFSRAAWARPHRVVVWDFKGLAVHEELLFSHAEIVRQEAIKISKEMNIRIIPQQYLPVYLKYYGGDCHNILGYCSEMKANRIDADYQAFGNLFKLDGKYILTLRVHETKEGKMVGLMTFQTEDSADLSQRLHAEVSNFLRRTLEVSRAEHPKVILFSSDSSEIPPKEEKVKRLIWEEERRRDLDQQLKQIRAYTEESWQEKATKDWENIVPKFNTGERHALLRQFLEKYEEASVTVEYIDPQTQKRTDKNVVLNIPKVGAARQELYFLKTFYHERLIPAGGFMMGCDEAGDGGCYPDEIPAHPVRLTRSFYMMQTEVTQGLYELVTGNNPSGHVGEEYPVDNVNWYDVIVFANQLSEREGFDKCYEYPSLAAHFPGGEVSWNRNCNGWRLPTEAEWERAAFGDENFVYSGSDFMDEVAWGIETGAEETQEGCLKRANGYDLCDMSGNISEWVWDACHEREKPKTLVVDPSFDSEPNIRKCYYLKGGSYKNTSELLRVSSMKFVLVGAGESPRGFFTYPGDGFRLVRSVVEQQADFHLENGKRITDLFRPRDRSCVVF